MFTIIPTSCCCNTDHSVRVGIVKIQTTVAFKLKLMLCCLNEYRYSRELIFETSVFLDWNAVVLLI